MDALLESGALDDAVKASSTSSGSPRPGATDLAIEAVLATREGSYFMVRVSMVLKEIDFRPKP